MSYVQHTTVYALIIVFYCLFGYYQSERMAWYNAPRVAAIVGFEHDHCEFREYTVFGRKLKSMSRSANSTCLDWPLKPNNFKKAKMGLGLVSTNTCATWSLFDRNKHIKFEIFISQAEGVKRKGHQVK